MREWSDGCRWNFPPGLVRIRYWTGKSSGCQIRTGPEPTWGVEGFTQNVWHAGGGILNFSPFSTEESGFVKMFEVKWVIGDKRGEEKRSKPNLLLCTREECIKLAAGEWMALWASFTSQCRAGLSPPPSFFLCVCVAAHRGGLGSERALMQLSAAASRLVITTSFLWRCLTEPSLFPSSSTFCRTTACDYIPHTGLGNNPWFFYCNGRNLCF